MLCSKKAAKKFSISLAIYTLTFEQTFLLCNISAKSFKTNNYYISYLLLLEICIVWIWPRRMLECLISSARDSFNGCFLTVPDKRIDVILAFLSFPGAVLMFLASSRSLKLFTSSSNLKNSQAYEHNPEKIKWICCQKSFQWTWTLSHNSSIDDECQTKSTKVSGNELIATILKIPHNLSVSVK